MAIATKQIAFGTLARNRSATAYIPVSGSSDWFESFVGTGTGLTEANALRLSLQIDKIETTPPGTTVEELNLHLFESDDLRDWEHVPGFTGLTATDRKVYSVDWEYGSGRKKYLRIQFSLDLDQLPFALPNIPYPAPSDHDVYYQGSCWVSVYHKR